MDLDVTPTISYRQIELLRVHGRDPFLKRPPVRVSLEWSFRHRRLWRLGGMNGERLPMGCIGISGANRAVLSLPPPTLEMEHPDFAETWEDSGAIYLLP